MKLQYKRGGFSIIRNEPITFKALTFSINSQNKSVIKIASKYLYKNADLYIERKHTVFNTWYEIEKTQCPKCKSFKTCWQIKNKYLKCNTCNNYSTIDCPII